MLSQIYFFLHILNIPSLYIQASLSPVQRFVACVGHPRGAGSLVFVTRIITTMLG